METSAHKRHCRSCLICLLVVATAIPLLMYADIVDTATLTSILVGNATSEDSSYIDLTSEPADSTLPSSGSKAGPFSNATAASNQITAGLAASINKMVKKNAQSTLSNLLRGGLGHGRILPPPPLLSKRPKCNNPKTCLGPCKQLQSFILAERPKKGWNRYYNDVADLIGKIAPNNVVFEIGTAFGGQAERLLARLPKIELNVVDPFMAGYDPKDGLSQMYSNLVRDYKLNNQQLSDLYAQAMAYDLGTTHYSCRYRLHHGTSTSMAPTFRDGTIGAIFVDGLHTKEGVEADIKAYWPKMAPGGLMIFNDYDVGVGANRFEGVKTAVDAKAAAIGQELQFVGDTGKSAGNVYVKVPAASASVVSQATAVSQAICDNPKACEGPCKQILDFIVGERPKKGWNRYYNDVADLIGKLAPNKVVFEIGTAFGGQAERLLARLPKIELNVVDPFMAGYDPKDGLSQMYSNLVREHGLTAPDLSKLYAQAMAYNLGSSHYGCRYRLHHGTSTGMASRFRDGSIGAIFVDGLHTQAGVEADIKAYWPKMAPGGLMIFNDYDVGVGDNRFPGVQAAVDAQAAAVKQKLKYVGDTGKSAGNVYLQVSRSWAPWVHTCTPGSKQPARSSTIATCPALMASPCLKGCERPPPAGAKATYATLVVSDRYIPGAQCLLHKLESSAYPVTVIHQGLTTQGLEKLKSSSKNKNVRLVAMQDLLDANHITSDAAGGNPYANEKKEAIPVWSSSWTSTTHLKLVYWLLIEFEWVVAMDTDILVLDNIDELMRCQSEDAPIAAVPIHPESAGGFFNSGVMGLRPSLSLYSELHGIAKAHNLGTIKVENALEGVIGDQSLLNHKFKSNFKALPKSFNLEKRWFERGCTKQGNFDRLGNGTYTIHFVADQKPWDRDLKKLSPELKKLDALWHEHCPM